MWSDAADVYFSNLVIPIGKNVFLGIVLFCVLLAAHEAHVAAGARPLFANHERSHNVPLQVVIVLSWIIMLMNVALLVPVSLDFSLAMGQSATASGVFIGGGTAFSVAGLIAGKPLTSEVNWNQRLARGIFLVCNSLCLVSLVGMAILVESAASWSLNTTRWAFWLIVFLNGMVAFLKAVLLLSWTTMWQIITPASEKTFWQMMAQCGRNGGLVLGPVAFAGLSFLVEQGRDVSPISMMSWSIVGLVVLQAVELACASLFYPTVLIDTSDKGPEVTSSQTEDASLVLSPEQLPPESRELIVKYMIAYSYERPFTLSAIEVATMMILERSYGWSPALCGSSFMVVGGASMIMTAFSSLLISRKWVAESQVFLAASVASLIGVFWLFDWKHFGPGTLLWADAMIYGGVSLSNGVGQGLATRAATKGTNYSIEKYRMHNLMAVNLSRFLGPIAARFIVDFGGRNTYAALQMIVCFLGTCTVYLTVCVIWAGASGVASKPDSSK